MYNYFIKKKLSALIYCTISNIELKPTHDNNAYGFRLCTKTIFTKYPRVT